MEYSNSFSEYSNQEGDRQPMENKLVGTNTLHLVLQIYPRPQQNKTPGTPKSPERSSYSSQVHLFLYVPTAFLLASITVFMTLRKMDVHFNCCLNFSEPKYSPLSWEGNNLNQDPKEPDCIKLEKFSKKRKITKITHTHSMEKEGK